MLISGLGGGGGLYASLNIWESKHDQKILTEDWPRSNAEQTQNANISSRHKIPEIKRQIKHQTFIKNVPPLNMLTCLQAFFIQTGNRSVSYKRSHFVDHPGGRYQSTMSRAISRTGVKTKFSQGKFKGKFVKPFKIPLYLKLKKQILV